METAPFRCRRSSADFVAFFSLRHAILDSRYERLHLGEQATFSTRKEGARRVCVRVFVCCTSAAKNIGLIKHTYLHLPRIRSGKNPEPCFIGLAPASSRCHRSGSLTWCWLGMGRYLRI